MKGEIPAGPEQATLAERFVGLAGLPYGWGCLLYGFILFGFLLFTLIYSTDPFPLIEDFAHALAPNHLATYLLGAYLLYSPRYMRLKTLETEPSISPLLENGEPSFHKLFGRISSLRPQLLAWLVSTVGLLVSLVLLPNPFGGAPLYFALPSSTPLLDLVEFVTSSLAFAFYGLGLSSSAWAYYSLLRGIHLSGSQPLKLRPYYSDRFLGLRPVGSLALSLALAYFGMVGLLIVILAVGPSTSIADVIGVYGLLGALTVLGLVMFFLPLRRLHIRMLEQKTLETRRLAERFEPLFKEASPDNPTGDRAQSMILDSLRLEIVDRKVSSMATWPFDFRVLGKLSVVILSVTAALIVRVIFLVLRV